MIPRCRPNSTVFFFIVASIVYEDDAPNIPCIIYHPFLRVQVAQRTLPFLQTCRQELRVLKIEMPPGSLACWGALSVLEILAVCQSYCEEVVGLAESLSRHTAALWAFAKNQVRVGFLLSSVFDLLMSLISSHS
jgi:hypothetical protein